MDYNTAHLGSWPAKLVLRVSHKIRSSKKYSNEAVAKQNAKEAEARRKRQSVNHPRESRDHGDVNELGERDYSVFSEAETLVEGHRKDHTDMMHRLAHHDSFDSLVDGPAVEKLRDPYFDSRALTKQATSVEHERMVASLPEEIWQRIASHLDALDAASLAISSKTLQRKLGNAPLKALDDPSNRALKTTFLHQTYDRHLPDHLLCFHCIAYHRRLNPGKEALKADYVAHPVFACPLVRSTVLPRTRITHLRYLPYPLIQLALREDALGPSHGLDHDSLSRHWKCRDSTWTHRTRYMTHDNHLLMRCVSQTFAPPALTVTGERHLLYDREEYVPFFSVCAHWRDGLLTQVCKCALSHVPKPPESYVNQLKKAPRLSQAAAHPNFIVTGCDFCRPLRRCPDCPSEYLVEIRMVEDASDPVNHFKHAIVVTRWADLGDGSSPITSPEWAAIEGRDAGAQGEKYESFERVGRRAVSGIFESRVSGGIPGQRMISLNPKREHKGEEGDDWY